MSLGDMTKRLSLEIPGLVQSYAKTLLNEALGTIYDTQKWSFQCKTSGWLTPGLLFPGGPGVSVGTITVTPFRNTVTGSASASAQWLAYIAASNLPLFTQLQIRSPFYSLYNIIGVDQTNPAAVILTLDRPWMEPGGALSYMIYQAYFPVPVSDFKRFESARDTTNDWRMDYWSKSQKDLALQDPQRVIFQDPAYIVPFEVDARPNSATLGNMLYELWPHPLSVLPYTYQYLRRGALMVAPSDTVPVPLTEDLVLWKAKEAAYLFKEAQKGEDMQRGAGANWQFLAEAAHEKYLMQLKPVKDRDRDLMELYYSKYQPDPYNAGEPFATETGQLNVGRM